MLPPLTFRARFGLLHSIQGMRDKIKNAARGEPAVPVRKSRKTHVRVEGKKP